MVGWITTGGLFVQVIARWRFGGSEKRWILWREVGICDVLYYFQDILWYIMYVYIYMYDIYMYLYMVPPNRCISFYSVFITPTSLMECSMSSLQIKTKKSHPSKLSKPYKSLQLATCKDPTFGLRGPILFKLGTWSKTCWLLGVETFMGDGNFLRITMFCHQNPMEKWRFLTT